MAKVSDGGSAFPIWTDDMNLGDTAGPGMSLRDWFAGQFVSNATWDLPTPEEVAQYAYKVADAMLDVREQARVNERQGDGDA